MVVPHSLVINVALLLAIMFFLVAINLRRFVEYQSWSLFNTACSFVFLGCFGTLMNIVGLGLRDTSLYLCMAWSGFIVGVSVWIWYHFTLTTLSSKELRYVFTGIADLALVFDYEGNITDANHPKQFAALFQGCTNLEAVLNTLSGKDQVVAISGETYDSWEFQLGDEDRDYLVSLFPVIHGKSVLGNVLLCHEITELKNSERDLVLLNQRLEQSNDQLDHYIKMTHLLEAEQHRVHLVNAIQGKLVDEVQTILQLIDKQQCDATYLAKRLRDIYTNTRKAVHAAFQKGVNLDD